MGMILNDTANNTHQHKYKDVIFDLLLTSKDLRQKNDDNRLHMKYCVTFLPVTFTNKVLSENFYL